MNIQQIKQQPNKAVIATPITGVLAAVYPAEQKAGYNPGETDAIQNCQLRQGGESIYVQFKNFPTDLTPIKGKTVTLEASQTQYGVKGVSVNRYFSNKKNEEVVSLRVTSTGKVTVGAGESVASAPASVPPMSAPQGQVQQQPARQTASKATVNGATVGMAINNSMSYFAACGEQFDAKKLHKMASDLVRVALYMEAGNLAPKEPLVPAELTQAVASIQPAAQIPVPPTYDPSSPHPVADEIPMDDEGDFPF